MMAGDRSEWFECMLADQGKWGVNSAAFHATAGNCDFLTVGKVLARPARFGGRLWVDQKGLWSRI